MAAVALSIEGFDQPLSSVIKDAHINTFSAYAAAQLAVKGFAELPPDASKTFIYTGNKLHVMPLQPLLSFGMGKSASAHMIHYLSELYKSSGYKYVYTLTNKVNVADEYTCHAGSITQMSVNRVESQRMIKSMVRRMATTTLSWQMIKSKDLGIGLLSKDRGM